jgi:PncC family amidohydrolase
MWWRQQSRVASVTSTAQVLTRLQSLGLKLAVAESLTGGLLCAEFVAIPGASAVVLGSVTAYQNQVKSQLLKVTALDVAGAVSAEVAIEMARGVRAQFAAAMQIDESSVVGVATTGVAGPDGQGGQPVGKVFVAVASDRGAVSVANLFAGNRDEIRSQAVAAAVALLWEQFR